VYGEDATYDYESGIVTYTDADGNRQEEEMHERDDQVKT
jgi:hypothetical protein